MTPPVALTLGDPAGIGGEIALKAWAALRAAGRPFFLIGDLGHMAALGAPAGAAGARRSPPRPRPAPRWPRACRCCTIRCRTRRPPGRPDPAQRRRRSSRSSPAPSRWPAAGEALAVCTNPIAKAVLKAGAGFAFPGHTEYLAHLCGAARPVMMLAAPALRVVPVTIHIPLAEVPAALTPDLLEATLRITHAALVADFGIAAPRLAVAGLNPHAGEGGVDGPRGDRRDRAGARPAARRGHAASPARTRPTRCSTRPPAPATTRRSACTTTRR